ncbi:hypothetical protein QJS66_07870 [Kocuria rhizophila]|nr:hypothetical protein QJS66_07870 [Kocuria rhizophila]
MHNAQPHFDRTPPPRAQRSAVVELLRARGTRTGWSPTAPSRPRSCRRTSRPVAAVDLPWSPTGSGARPARNSPPTEPFARASGDARQQRGSSRHPRRRTRGRRCWCAAPPETPELGRELTRLAATPAWIWRTASSAPRGSRGARAAGRGDRAALHALRRALRCAGRRPWAWAPRWSPRTCPPCACRPAATTASPPPTRDTRAFGATLRAVYDDAATPRRDRRAVAGGPRRPGSHGGPRAGTWTS